MKKKHLPSSPVNESSSLFRERFYTLVCTFLFFHGVSPVNGSVLKWTPHPPHPDRPL